MTATTAEVLRVTFTRIMPAGFIVGAGMETFMYFTGFWKIATRKASERQEEEAYNRKLLREQKEQRQRTVLFDLYAEQEKESNNKKETTTLR